MSDGPQYHGDIEVPWWDEEKADVIWRSVDGFGRNHGAQPSDGPPREWDGPRCAVQYLPGNAINIRILPGQKRFLTRRIDA
jgi:hypothetical protein